jgi:hypothetical protein
VFSTWSAKRNYVQVREMWCGFVRGTLFSRISLKSEFTTKERVCVWWENCHPKVPWNFCSNLKYVSNKIFTLHFM